MTSIEPTEAIRRFPELARLGDEWEWQERPTSRVRLWGTYGKFGLQVGIFIYDDGLSSVISLEWSQFASQHSGGLARMVSHAKELLERPLRQPW